MQGALGHADIFKCEVREPREVKRLNHGTQEVELAQGSHTEGGREAKGRRRRLSARPVNPAQTDVKLLEAVERRGAQPGVHSGRAVVEEVRRDAEAEAGAGVVGEDAGDGLGAGLVAGVGELAAVEVERVVAPDVAPPGGEGLDAGGVPGGEEGDDFAEDGVGEAADVVDADAAAAFIAWWRGGRWRRCKLGIRNLRGLRRGLAGLSLPRIRLPPLRTGTRRLHLCARRPAACGAGV